VSQTLLESMDTGDPAGIDLATWLTQLGREYGCVLFEHPNAVPILLAHRTRARTLPITERILAVLADHGIDPVDGIAILDTVEAFCLGFGHTRTRPGTWRTPPADDEDEYPQLAAASRAGHHRPGEVFENGLRLLVTGLLLTDHP